MNAILKSKSMRLLSALLAVLMIVAMLPTSAFAWSAEEGTKCTSTYGDKYLGSDGDNYYSKAGNTLFYNDDGSFYVSYHSGGVARYKYLMIDSNGTSHHVYCIESGVSYNYSDTYNSTSGKNSKYFQNLPVTAQYGIMMALMYGWHDGASSPVAGTNVDDFIYATQCIIWEYQQQIRTSPTSLASAKVEANKKNAVRHAYFREYLALQRLCLLILQHQKHQIGSGSRQIYGILFDGAWLWEEYVSSLIDDVFFHPMNKGGTGAQRLFDGNVGLIYPDFISRDNETRIIADAKYKPIDNIGNKDYLQVLAYMFRFDAKAGYYLYPEAAGTADRRLWMNKGSTYEANVAPRDDICLTKHGLKIPVDAENYEMFVFQMKVSEAEFRQVFAAR